MLLRPLVGLALLLAGCSCEHERDATEAHLAPEHVEIQAAPEWPRALVADLPPATPATLVTVHADHIEVDNRALIATWPADELAHARSGAPSDAPAWPELSSSVSDLEDGAPLEIARLRELLSSARRAERAGTGAGTGAGVFNLRVASDVPFSLVERVLYSAARAGYGTPRVVLDASDGRRMLAWPSAPPRRAPSREEIESALRAATGGQPVAESMTEGSHEPRATLTRDRIELRQGEAIACTLDGAIDARALGRCAGPLRSGGPTIALAVAPDVGFGRVAPAIQALSRAFPHLRVTRGAAPRAGRLRGSL